MGLSDAQIDRFSRQIILPQIGGTGQTRLLESSVAIGGDGELAEIAALYLAGAGIGHITLYGAGRGALRNELIDLNPDVHVTVASGAFGRRDVDVLVACGVTLADLDCAAASGRPLIAGGVFGDGGWLVVAATADVCASCAAREAGGFGVRELAPALGWEGGCSPKRLADPTHPAPKREQAPALQKPERAAALQSGPSAGVIGSLMALAVLKIRLGLGEPSPPMWLRFDALQSTLTEQPLVRAADCRTCATA